MIWGITLEAMSKAATVAFAQCCCSMYTFWAGLKQWWIKAAVSAADIKYVNKQTKKASFKWIL